MKKKKTSLFSHELRTLVNVIQEGLSIVLDEIDGPINKNQKETLDIVKNNVARLFNLIQKAKI